MGGKDRGKQGKILSVDIRNNQVVVENLNLFKKHKRPTKSGEKGETVSLSRPINAAKTMIVCRNCSKPTRIGMKLSEGSKARVCKKCSSLLD